MKSGQYIFSNLGKSFVTHIWEAFRTVFDYQLPTENLRENTNNNDIQRVLENKSKPSLHSVEREGIIRTETSQHKGRISKRKNESGVFFLKKKLNKIHKP